MAIRMHATWHLQAARCLHAPWVTCNACMIPTQSCKLLYVGLSMATRMHVGCMHHLLLRTDTHVRCMHCVCTQVSTLQKQLEEAHSENQGLIKGMQAWGFSPSRISAGGAGRGSGRGSGDGSGGMEEDAPGVSGRGVSGAGDAADPALAEVGRTYTRTHTDTRTHGDACTDACMCVQSPKSKVCWVRLFGWTFVCRVCVLCCVLCCRLWRPYRSNWRSGRLHTPRHSSP